MLLCLSPNSPLPSPLPRQTVKHHPASVDLELVKRLSGASTEGKLLSFLSKSFACVNRELAGRIVDEMQAGVTADTAPSELTLQQVARLHQLLHEVKFPDPTGDHLSPAGESVRPVVSRGSWIGSPRAG